MTSESESFFRLSWRRPLGLMFWKKLSTIGRTKW
jgi:hypothetical protein